MKKILLSYIIFLIGFPVWSQIQPVLTLEEAVSLTLENNFDIRIAKNELRIDQENVTIGNAGMLPNINGTVTNNNTILNQTQTQASGNEIEIDGAQNVNINYGVGIEWTIFDGFRMFARHNQLKELQNLGATELKLSVLSRVSAVYQTYFTLSTQQQQLKMIDSIISVSEFRLKTAKNRLTIGKASKLEVLNAEVDLNADLSAKIQLNEQYSISKVTLNELLVRPLDTDFKVSDVISIDSSLLLPDLLSSAEKQNPQLQIQYINKKIQEYELKQVKANRFPTISLLGGYNLIRSQTPFGFVTESTGRNFVYGFSATLNIFDGFNQNRNEKVAKIQLENTQLQIERQSQLIQSQVASLYQSYLSNLSLLELERKNEGIAKQNLEITLEKFKIGSVAPIEFRTAQENYGNAVIRLTSAELQAKQSEISLRELAGSLSF
ncbi:MAG TPA: TolC family protein [Flavobacterium sp.]|uniref:TolC family protein n=2 Tax=Flavobacterium TaxID=237 RepID=UPI0025C258FA|nr:MULTISPECIES: TolC family protein [unclassified Flavobacterium]HRE78495.1 TolC family protein [Flavobacterium sp.]